VGTTRLATAESSTLSSIIGQLSETAYSETVGRQFTAHYDSRCCRLCTLYHNINSRLMVKAPMQKTLYTAIVYIYNDFIHTGNALGL